MPTSGREQMANLLVSPPVLAGETRRLGVDGPRPAREDLPSTYSGRLTLSGNGTPSRWRPCEISERPRSRIR